MRSASILLAACLLTAAVAMAPTASSAADPIGDCEDPGSVLTVCWIVCIQPPCYSYICVEKPVRHCEPI